MSADPIAQIAALGLEPTYSAREAAGLLGRSYSWLDQRVRNDDFVLPDGTPVRPLRTAGGYRRFTTTMLREMAFSSYRHHWFKMDEVKAALCELAMAAYREPPLKAAVQGWRGL
jgi:hypothetical protein